MNIVFKKIKTMKKQLIKTENYFFVIDDSELKDGDYCTTSFNDNDISWTTFSSKNPQKDCKKIIAHIPLNNYPTIDGLAIFPWPSEVSVKKDNIDLQRLFFGVVLIICGIYVLATGIGGEKALSAIPFVMSLYPLTKIGFENRYKV